MGLNDKYFLNPAHLHLCRERYFLKDDNGQPVETDIEEVFRRETSHIFQNDTDEARTEALSLRCQKKILPAGRPLANAGTSIKNLYNCFVISIDDTREAISEMKARHFHIQANGGGVGCDYSTLRPEGSICKATQGHSSGSIGFITDISYQSSNIQQGGARSGANMGLLHDWHPDFYEFITYKSRHNHEAVRKFASVFDEDEFEYWKWDNHHKWQMFNVSTGLSDEFMRQAMCKSDKPWVLQWNDTEWPLWDFENTVGPYTGAKYVKKFTVSAPNKEIAHYKARYKIPWGSDKGLKLIREAYHLTASEYLDLIAQNAWEDGCPGVVFFDVVRRFHNLEYISPIAAPNPCAEQMLSNDASCNLVSIVWPTIADSGLEKVVRSAVRSADNVVDVSECGDDLINEKARQERRIGLGSTGVAEWLIQKKLRYSSDEGREAVADRLRKIRDYAYLASVELAKERGPFVGFDFQQYSQSAFFKTLPAHIQQEIEKYGIRHGTILTQAPVGSTGSAIGYSQGCEPWFAMRFRRNSKVGVFEDGSPAFNQWLKENNLDYSAYDYSLARLKEKVDVPDYFEEAHSVSLFDHLKMQAVFSKYVDTSVSKTLNCPNETPPEKIREVFEQAWKLGIKSTTVYRDGSKQQVLEHLKKSREATKILSAVAPSRPKELPCDIHHVTVRGEKWTVIVGLLNSKPYEVFCSLQTAFELSPKYKTGTVVCERGKKYALDLGDFKIKDIASYLEQDEHKIITRLLSSSLRHGAPVEYLVKQLNKADGTVVDLSKAIARVLRKYEAPSVSGIVCEKCGSTNTVKTSTCYECHDCSFSKCG